MPAYLMYARGNARVRAAICASIANVYLSSSECAKIITRNCERRVEARLRGMPTYNRSAPSPGYLFYLSDNTPLWANRECGCAGNDWLFIITRGVRVISCAQAAVKNRTAGIGIEKNHRRFSSRLCLLYLDSGHTLSLLLLLLLLFSCSFFSPFSLPSPLRRRRRRPRGTLSIAVSRAYSHPLSSRSNFNIALLTISTPPSTPRRPPPLIDSFLFPPFFFKPRKPRASIGRYLYRRVRMKRSRRTGSALAFSSRFISGRWRRVRGSSLFRRYLFVSRDKRYPSISGGVDRRARGSRLASRVSDERETKSALPFNSHGIRCSTREDYAAGFHSGGGDRDTTARIRAEGGTAGKSCPLCRTCTMLIDGDCFIAGLLNGGMLDVRA